MLKILMCMEKRKYKDMKTIEDACIQGFLPVWDCTDK